MEGYILPSANAKNKKDKYSVRYSFKNNIAPILDGSRKGKELMTPLIVIWNPNTWNTNNGVIVMYPRAST